MVQECVLRFGERGGGGGGLVSVRSVEAHTETQGQVALIYM